MKEFLDAIALMLAEAYLRDKAKAALSNDQENKEVTEDEKGA